MVRIISVVLVLTGFLSAANADPVPRNSAAETFLVKESGVVIFLGSDGREKGRRERHITYEVLSPDGRWIAYIALGGVPLRAQVFIQGRERKDDPAILPLIWDVPAMSGGLLVWAADSKRVLIGENRPGRPGTLEYAYRVYELEKGKLTELKLPDGHWVTGWSPDGKRLLTDARTGDGNLRIAWLNADGTGEPEFITPDEEMAYGARLSRDGRRVLFQAGPKGLKWERTKMRLYAMDLATKKRTAVDEPGVTEGWCWSPDGSKVAYTWQRSLDKPAEVKERETLLITCTADGSNRKTITKRQYQVPENSSGRSSIVFFFEVLDWR
jgi:Tol biopolymer transport system component